MEATSAGLTTGTLGAFTIVHGAATQTRPDRLDRQPHLRRDARPDRDDPGRRRQHRHLRQHDRRRLRQGLRRRHRHRHRQRDRRRAASPPRRSPAQLAGSVTMEATSAGLTTGTLGAFTVVHGAATQIALTGADREPRPRARRASSPRRSRTRPATPSPPTTPPSSPSPRPPARAPSPAPATPPPPAASPPRRSPARSPAR